MQLVAGEWSSGEIESVRGFWSRWRGLMGRSPRPLLIATRSVHGFWLSEPVWAVALDHRWEVVAVRMLGRRHIVSFSRAAWVLELPLPLQPPPVGARLTPEGGPGESAPR